MNARLRPTDLDRAHALVTAKYALADKALAAEAAARYGEAEVLRELAAEMDVRGEKLLHHKPSH